MHRTQDPGTTNLTDSTQGANRLSVPERIKNYNAGIQYSRPLHRCCTSLDLEATFKEIKISQNIEKEVCAHMHSCQGCRAHLHPQCLPILVTNKSATWWKTSHCRYCILQCNHLPMKKLIEKLQQFVEHLNITG